MTRNCSIAIVLWFVLAGAYFYVLRNNPGGDKYWAAVVMATVVWVGVVMIQGVRFSLRDWNARKRMARGERPRDGDLAAAIGPVSAGFDTLRAPFSGRECVLYSYDIGPRASGDGRPARDYTGFGMARCSVRTPYGEIALGAFPVLEHVFETEVDRSAAAAYVESTNFEELGGVIGAVRKMMSVHTTAPPIRKDWKIGKPSVDVRHAEVIEKIIAPGETITAFGRYVAASNSIVSDTKEKGFLRLRRGGDALHPPTVPWNAIGSLLGGLALIAAANLVFVYLLHHTPAS